MAGFYRILAFLPIDSSGEVRHYADEESMQGRRVMRNVPDKVDPVTETPAADPNEARAHFQRLLAVETDCWDVNAAIRGGNPGFVLLDVRSPELFVAGHVAGAINLPYRRI